MPRYAVERSAAPSRYWINDSRCWELVDNQPRRPDQRLIGENMLYDHAKQCADLLNKNSEAEEKLLASAAQ